jgi:hypothetical protein
MTEYMLLKYKAKVEHIHIFFFFWYIIFFYICSYFFHNIKHSFFITLT